MEDFKVNPKRILLLIPNLNFGGAQRVFNLLAQELSKKHVVYECVFNKDLGVAFASGNNLISLDVPAGNNSFLKLFRFYQRVVKLRKIKNECDIDISISHLEGADYINILGRAHDKVVLCIHGSKDYDGNIRGYMGIIRKFFLIPGLYAFSDEIITVSKGIKRELSESYGLSPTKINVINNSFDIEFIQQSAEENINQQYERIFSSYITIIVSGRLAFEKNYVSLLHVFAALKNRMACKLIVIGDGDEKQNLLNETDALGLKTYVVWGEQVCAQTCDVFFLGYQANPFKYLARASIFALTSHNEGFPMALGEAMVCGIPVVASDCPTGPREMLAPQSEERKKINQAEFAEYGILMPMLKSISDEEAISIWVNTLVKVLNDEDLRNHYGRKGQERMQEFSREKIMRQWLSVIEQE